MPSSSILHVRWPLFGIYPFSASFFWLAYLRLTDVLSRRYAPLQYGQMNEFNQKCFRQNLLSGLHTSLSTICLLGALLCDSGLYDGTSRRLYAHDSLLLYLDISMSLGYFSYALPMSIIMARAGLPYGSKLMVCHHALVVVAQTTYLLTQIASGYMAASGFLFELTNVFFVPYLIFLQLNIESGRLLGVLLVIVYTLSRCVACSYLAVLSMRDLTLFAPPAENSTAFWLAALVGLICFYGLLAISWSWYITVILPALQQGLQGAVGDDCQVCCPSAIRRCVWRRLSAEGRTHVALMRQRFAALEELRAEMPDGLPPLGTVT